MNVNSENLRFIMGFKLKQFRHERGLSLKELAEQTGLSISYLSEIEKGKKYPKPEKILQLAAALGVSFDEMVSLQVKKELHPLPVIFSSPVIKEFPFRMYGISPQDLLALITGDPEKAGALIRTFLEIGQEYDMRVEHLLFVALRSYQQMHQNYFEDIEKAVYDFISRNGFSADTPVDPEQLHRYLVDHHGYVVDEHTLEKYPELQDFRSVWIDVNKPKLLIRKDLPTSKKTFIMGREIGYQFLQLKERANTFNWMKVESFEQLLNNFKASYFAGALLMNRDILCRDLKEFFSKKHWEGEELLNLLRRYAVTPGMFLYRLCELLPKFFGLREILFLRFSNPQGSESYHLSRMFNMSPVFIPNGIGMREHYCRRWISIKLLKSLAEKQRHENAGTAEVLVAAQRSRFLDLGVEFFSIAFAGSTEPEMRNNFSGSISFLLNAHFKKTVAFWNDPEVPRLEVNETCERCGLSEARCRDRAAPSTIFQKQQEMNKKERILNQLLQNMK